MKLKVFVLGCVLSSLFLSCASTPLRQENSDFVRETGLSLIFAQRGLFSLKGENPAVADFYAKFSAQSVVLKHDAAQTEIVTFAHTDTDSVVTVNSFFTKYTGDNANVLLTAILVSASAFEASSPDVELGKTLFFKVLKSYIDSGYDVSGISGSEWYTTQTLTVTENSISLQ